MSRSLKILAPIRYPWRFNSPRNSRHQIETRFFVPLNKISEKAEGITVFNPFPLKHFDLVHAFNRIPLGNKPFLIGFESHLPRGFGIEKTPFFSWMRSLLSSERCRGIIAISDYAKRQFLRQHQGRAEYDRLEKKLEVRYPNLVLPDLSSGQREPMSPLKLVFVGNHFGRKGGSVAVRIAKLASDRGIPLQLDIVSSLVLGEGSWVSPTQKAYWKRDLEMMETLPSITWHKDLSNQRVLDIVREAHFSLLPTFSDSFGYSVLESMALGTPVIATAQAAIPELIQDKKNGFLLEIETDAFGEWTHLFRNDRDSKAYERLFDDEVDRLARESLKRIEASFNAQKDYFRMRQEARATAEALFSSKDANLFWDERYERAVS